MTTTIPVGAEFERIGRLYPLHPKRYGMIVTLSPTSIPYLLGSFLPCVGEERSCTALLGSAGYTEGIVILWYKYGKIC